MVDRRKDTDRLLYISCWVLAFPSLLAAIGSVLFLLKLYLTKSVFLSHGLIGFYVSVSLIDVIIWLGIVAAFSVPASLLCCLLLVVRSRLERSRRHLAIFVAALGAAGLLVALVTIPRIIPAP